MNMNRLIPPKDCDDLAYWLSCVVWDAIRDAQDAGMTEDETAILLDVVACSCARRAGREPLRYIGTRSSDSPDLHERLLDAAMTARGELLPSGETRCIGFGEVGCDGWPRWVVVDEHRQYAVALAEIGWIAGTVAIWTEDDGDREPLRCFREWEAADLENEVGLCEMFPSVFADPRTWCEAEQP